MDYSQGTLTWGSGDTDPISTTYTVSGLSFQPKAIRITTFGIISDGISTNSLVFAVGFVASSSSRASVMTYSVDGGTVALIGACYSSDCVCNYGGGDGILDISSIASDGFVLIVDEALNSPDNLSVIWEAWGGSDVTACYVGSIAEPGATGNQNYTATGLTSDGVNQVVMFAGCQSTSASNTVSNTVDSGLSIGYASSTTSADNVFVVANSDDASDPTDTDRASNTGSCLAMITAGGGATNALAALTAFSTNQFTLNWSARGTTNRRYIYMAIKGGSWKAGGYTINNSTLNNTTAVTGVGFQPEGGNLIGVNAAAGNTTIARLSYGMFTSTSNRRSVGIQDDNNVGTTAVGFGTVTTGALYFVTSSNAADARYDISAVGSDGFTVIVDDVPTTTSTTEFQGYLVWAGQLASSYDPFGWFGIFGI